MIPVIWRGPIFDPSGYAEDARLFLRGLDQEKVSFAVCPVTWDPRRVELSEEEQRLFFSHRSGTLDGDYIFLNHLFPPHYALDPQATYRVGRTLFETDRIPESWVAPLNEQDQVWVASPFNQKTFSESGVIPEKIRILPNAFDETMYTKTGPRFPFNHRPDFLFLTAFDYSPRKGFDLLLQAWVQTFSKKDSVGLLVKTYSSGGRSSLEIEKDIDQYLAKLGTDRQNIAPLYFIHDILTREQMAALYRLSDVFVLPTRGEGWGRTLMEAMACGVPCISSAWSAPLDFMNQHNAYLVPGQVVEVPEVYARFHQTFRGHRWFEPDLHSLSSALQQSTLNIGERQSKALRAHEEMYKKYTIPIIARALISLLNEFQARRTRLNKKPAMRCVWQGPLFLNESLAHVSRHYLRELTGLNHEHRDWTLIPMELRGLSLFYKNFPELLEKVRLVPPHENRLTIRHSWPPIWEKPPEGKWVLIQPWEYGSLPKSWIPFLELPDEIWVPSHFVKKIYEQDGVAGEKIGVIPNGIDPDVLTPEGEKFQGLEQGRFVFLFVGGLIRRKGIDLLLKAWKRCFSRNDPVLLVIKSVGHRGVYEKQSEFKLLRSGMEDPAAGQIIHIEADLSDSQMASLYRSADILVHPYRAEGFALPVIEALACGTPVLVTEGGPTDDFCRPDFSFRIPATPVGIQMNEPAVHTPWWLEPDFEVFCETMKMLVTKKDLLSGMGRKASGFVHDGWTWKQAALKINARIHALTKC